MHTLFFTSLLLAGCGESDPGANGAEIQPSASTLAAEAKPTTGKPSVASDDGFARILVIAGSLPSAEPKGKIESLLAARAEARGTEQYHIDLALTRVLGAYARACPADSAQPAFDSGPVSPKPEIAQ